jgi:unspecific monooxygenase
LIFAGHDTTSVALAWVLEQAVPREDVVQRITDELQQVTGGAPLGANQLNQLVYLDATIREGLRVRTIMPFVVRLTKTPFTAGGREYPAGVALCPCSHLVHRLELLYPEPETFRPERFLERHYASHEWFPFGGGARMCLGMAFALYEMKVILSAVFATIRLARPPGLRSVPVRRGIALAPDDGALMVVESAAGTSPNS